MFTMAEWRHDAGIWRSLVISWCRSSWLMAVFRNLKLDLNGLYRYITKTAQFPLASLRAGSTLSHARAREAERKSVSKESHRIPFVITFNPAWRKIPQVISSNLNILRSSQRCLEAFSSLPRISYRRCKNLRDILVRAKHRRQAPPASGAFRCHRNRSFHCRGNHILHFLLYQRTKTHTTSHHLLFFQSRLYVQCNKCNVQYIGETKRHLSDRFDEHRRRTQTNNRRSHRKATHW